MKETDRELLELAAKAAGYTRPAFIDSLFFIPDPKKNKHEYITDWTAWNPRTDDGDALRLAVSCSLEIYHAENDGVMVCVAGYEAHDGRIRYVIEPHGDDKHAATRRTIVRAAAEIGKAM